MSLEAKFRGANFSLFCVNRERNEIIPILTDIITLKLVFKKPVEGSFMESLFCSPCNQAVVKAPMVSHVLIKDQLAKLLTLVGKTFYFCSVCDFYVQRKMLNLMKALEIILKKLDIT